MRTEFQRPAVTPGSIPALAANRVRRRSASPSTQTAQGGCTSATMRPMKSRASRRRVLGGRAIPCISGIARNACSPSLRPPLGVLVPWSSRRGLSCRRNLAQMDLFQAANGRLLEGGRHFAGTACQRRVRTAASYVAAFGHVPTESGDAGNLNPLRFT
jgi:hypothetical protein